LTNRIAELHEDEPPKN